VVLVVHGVLSDVNNTRAEIVKWVAESLRPFEIVKDQGFQCLMKTVTCTKLVWCMAD
jgi:hypothetical protein